jgi:pimeloyl-ACP methyl ester carboxylesterase
MRPSRLSSIALVVFALAGCSSATAPTGGASSAAGPTPSENESAGREIAELIDVGDGRSLYLTCKGEGSPTVLMISGTRGGADEWDTLLPDADSDATSSFDAVAQTTRVCAYDRPGTSDASDQPTTSSIVPQPVTARQSARDLHALMTAADEAGPYIVVGLSWGGFIAQQFARTYADDVEGIVLLDSASAYLQESLTREQWAAWMAVIETSIDAAGSEAPAYEPSIDDLRAAAEPSRIPAVVLSSDHPWDLQVTPGVSTWPAWVAAQAALAASLNATHITETDSGHGISVEQPALVTDAILDVVEEVRAAR